MGSAQRGHCDVEKDAWATMVVMGCKRSGQRRAHCPVFLNAVLSSETYWQRLRYKKIGRKGTLLGHYHNDSISRWAACSVSHLP